MKQPAKIALIGLGKIVRDQHLPALRASRDLALVAGSDPHAEVPGLAHYAGLEALLEAQPGVQAVAICTPPQLRHELARRALLAGRHVLLEKPPCATLSQLGDLQALAQQRGLTLFTAWHSRYAAAVETARGWLARRALRAITVTWKEDVRRWHPGQSWLWRAGGLGVFDPGINALSVLTRILPAPLSLRQALLDFPANCQTPIAAMLELTCEAAAVHAEFDFRQTGAQSWDIAITSAAGEELLLSQGGRTLHIGGERISEAPDTEYPMLYAHFAQLIAAHASDVDERPLRLVADALLVGERRTVEEFHE